MRHPTTYFGHFCCFGLLLALGCGGGTPPPQLTFYTTCGDPVCAGHRDTGVAPCTTEKEGASCTTEGQRCDPVNSCNSLLLCAASDPKKGPGGCPISRRKDKAEIRYVDPAEGQRLYEELRAIRLATYRYAHSGPAGRRHLGFLIDDQPGGLSVDPERDMVDLYGYASLAVAALQVQAKQIEALQGEVARLRGLLEKDGGPRSRPRPTAATPPAGQR
jgi:hypothetical protein